jgi:hypothetical protein
MGDGNTFDVLRIHQRLKTQLRPGFVFHQFRPCHPIDACECCRITFQYAVKQEDLYR